MRGLPITNNVLLLSKCIAGGLSAALILLWWPRLASGDALSAWLGRGVAFTLSFELMLLGLRPLEQALWATRFGTRVSARLDALAARLRQGDALRRLGSSAAVAAAALALPVLLIVAGLGERPGRDAGARKRPVRIVRVTKIVRPVKVSRVVVPRETPAAAPTRTTRLAPGAAKPSSERKPAVLRTKGAKPRTGETLVPTDRQPAKAPGGERAAPEAQSCSPTPCTQDQDERQTG